MLKILDAKKDNAVNVGVKINTNKFSNTRLHRISKHKLGPIHSVKNTFVKISNDESSAARITGNIMILS